MAKKNNDFKFSLIIISKDIIFNPFLSLQSPFSYVQQVELGQCLSASAMLVQIFPSDASCSPAGQPKNWNEKKSQWLRSGQVEIKLLKINIFAGVRPQRNTWAHFWRRDSRAISWIYLKSFMNPKRCIEIR